jgi:hypothetical protein
MMTNNYNIKIQNETFGVLLSETFIDSAQFKLFLKMVQGCLELKEDLTFFNGSDFLIHVPYKYLVESIINTSTSQITLADHMRSKIESLVSVEDKK